MDTYGSMLLDAIDTHMLYVIVSVALEFTVGVLLGILLSRVPKISVNITSFINFPDYSGVGFYRYIVSYYRNETDNGYNSIVCLRCIPCVEEYICGNIGC